MKRILFIALLSPLLFLSFFAQAQSARDNDQVFFKVRRLFNEHKADSIYQMTGEGFRKHVDSASFMSVSEEKLYPLGTIQEADFMTYRSGVSSYKVTYGAMTLEMLIGVDKEGKIEALAFKQYLKAVDDKDYVVATSNPLQTDFEKQLDTVARQYISKVNTVGLAIGILKEGKVQFYAYGETEKENRKLPNEGSIFEIGSITKTFTATLLAYYVNEKKISLSDPIIKYLPDSVAANPQLKGITISMLSNHTSGLPRMPENFVQDPADSLDPYKHYTVDLLYSAVKDCTLQSKPGEKYEYSNFAVALLGNILEHISQKSFEAMVEEVICNPLLMQHTWQHLPETQQKDFVRLYNEDGNPTPAWNFLAFAPAGALHSNISDLLLFAKANMQKDRSKLSNAMALTHKITYSGTPKVALGWHILTTNNQPIYWHNGGTYGSSSYIAFEPSKQIAVVILSNAAESVDVMALSILRLLQ